MTMCRKYAEFNDEKDAEYVKFCMDVVNEALIKLAGAGVRSYMWHHELDLPHRFGEIYPEALNEYGDVEVTHPRVRDYLEHKIIDFFDAYPKMDGIILTLHETKVPLLKLKKQKLGKTERVKYVTEILYKVCKSLGKELIVRPFASLEEDYEMMTRAYEQISTDLVIMDKWTQFDWSLTLPDNKFYNKVKNNPLFVETDIFGEFFGKGKLPLMLRDHITKKFAYCEDFNPVGYVSRIDRSGRHPFGTVNEVNLDIMHAVMCGDDVDEAIDTFFKKKYGDVAGEVRGIMENTEDILKKIIYLKGYYYSECSLFPSLQHAKNHFYFEMIKENFDIASDEWFIPIGWERGTLDSIMEEKESALREAKAAYEKLLTLRERLDSEEYNKLYLMFKNLYYTADMWNELTHLFYAYTTYFVTRDAAYEREFYNRALNIERINKAGEEEFKNDFYCIFGDIYKGVGKVTVVKDFLSDVKESFEIEKRTTSMLEGEGLVDFVVAGGAMEGHRLKKEVNFSAVRAIDGELCRIPGTPIHGYKIKAHGWFSYEIKLVPGAKNNITVKFGSTDDVLSVKVSIGENSLEITEPIYDRREITFPYEAKEGEESVRIRFDKISGHVPCIYTIKVEA